MPAGPAYVSAPVLRFSVTRKTRRAGVVGSYGTYSGWAKSNGFGCRLNQYWISASSLLNQYWRPHLLNFEKPFKSSQGSSLFCPQPLMETHAEAIKKNTETGRSELCLAVFALRARRSEVCCLLGPGTRRRGSQVILGWRFG